MTTPATQAILPVTQEARDAAAGIAEDLAINSDMFAPLIRNGEHDRHPFVQAFAIFERDILERQVHSLPGMREALEWYGEQARLARLIHSGGEAGRHALAADGGKRARAVLSETEAGRACKARAGRTDANDPQDCNWPVCGCDPHADKVIAALDEMGLLAALAPSALEPVQKLHELPRDVGARAVELLREYMDAEEIDDVDARSSELGACRFSVRAFLAAHQGAGE